MASLSDRDVMFHGNPSRLAGPPWSRAIAGSKSRKLRAGPGYYFWFRWFHRLWLAHVFRAKHHPVVRSLAPAGGSDPSGDSSRGRKTRAPQASRQPMRTTDSGCGPWRHTVTHSQGTPELAGTPSDLGLSAL